MTAADRSVCFRWWLLAVAGLAGFILLGFTFVTDSKPIDGWNATLKECSKPSAKPAIRPGNRQQQ